MAGTSQHNVRSSFAAETVAGITNATPGFSTTHDPILMTAKPEIYEQPSLTAGGAIAGIGIKSIPITGKLGGAFVYGVIDDWLASLLQGAWATNSLVDGKTKSTFTVENTFTAGSGGTPNMLRYRGVEATGGKLTLSNNADAQFTLDVLGIGFTAATAVGITGATYADPTNAVPLTSGIDVGAITMATFSPGGIQSAEIDFVFDGRDPQTLVTGLDTGGTTIGAFRPKITATAFVDTGSIALYSAAQSAGAAFAVTFNIGSVSGSKYTLTFPKCSLGSGDIDLSGKELLQKLEITPLYDATSSAVLTVARAVT